MSNDASQVIIGIETYDAFSSELHATYEKIEDMMPSEFSLYKWSELNATELENFASTKLLLLLIMFLIVLVATVNISSALVMLVMERRREIAILKSIGASNSGISASFIVIGTCIGALGILVGVPFGLLAAINVNKIITFLEWIINFFTQAIFSLFTKDGFSTIHLLDPAFYLEEVPVIIPFLELFIIVALTLLLSIIVSVIPSIKAGKEKPLSILRKV
jgi:lipoprotein-releasing system permease protein